MCKVFSAKGDWYQNWNSTLETTTLSPYWKENEEFGCSYNHLTTLAKYYLKTKKFPKPRLYPHEPLA